MVEVLTVLLGISLIIFFGAFAEFLFKKIRVPDVLLLVLIGLLIGPHGLKYVNPAQLSAYAPVFTTFTLLFLLYDGAFNISLKSLAKGTVKSLGVTLSNFLLSVALVTAVMLLFRFDPLTSLLTGCILGGVSSAFVIPLLKIMNVEGETYSILTLESAITDVLCIVSALTVMEIIVTDSFSIQLALSKVAGLFAVAGLVGVVAGIIWILLVTRIFKSHKSYIITVAYLLLVYVVAEFLRGNGAIAALFFGLVLKNSWDLTGIFGNILHGGEKPEANGNHYGISVTTKEEEFFYSEISFFLKIFFFVYIGLLLDLSNTTILAIAAALSLVIMLGRAASGFILKGMSEEDKNLITAIFARGLAAAAIAQIVLMSNLAHAVEIAGITNTVIVFTILLSSVRIFLLPKKTEEEKKEPILFRLPRRSVGKSPAQADVC